MRIPRARLPATWGHRDLTQDEVKRQSRELFGTEGTLYFNQETRQMVVGRFLDGRGQRPMKADGHPVLPKDRPEYIYGTGFTWHEAFQRARIALINEVKQ